MGFTAHEKNELRSLIRSNDKTLEDRKFEMREDLFSFWRTQNFLKHTADYGIFPINSVQRKNGVENIIISKFNDGGFILVDLIEQINDIVSGSYILKIDCSMIIANALEEKYRFVHPHRFKVWNCSIIY